LRVASLPELVAAIEDVEEKGRGEYEVKDEYYAIVLEEVARKRFFVVERDGNKVIILDPARFHPTSKAIERKSRLLADVLSELIASSTLVDVVEVRGWRELKSVLEKWCAGDALVYGLSRVWGSRFALLCSGGYVKAAAFEDYEAVYGLDAIRLAYNTLPAVVLRYKLP